MKTQKINRPQKAILLAILVFIMLPLVTSCTHNFPFLNSSVVPGAKGFVEIKKDNNKNYTVKVEVLDLAEVGKVQSTKTTYVVWMETDKGNAENLGQLKSSTSFFSKRHTASLKTVSSFKPTKIFITTENGTNVQYPGEQVVLSTDNISVK